MIKGNRIYFGYGTVAVGSLLGQEYIQLSEIKPPQEIGQGIDNKIKHNKVTNISANKQEFNQLLDKLDRIVQDKKGIVEFKGYILDFNKYNKGSIDVLREHIMDAQGICFMALAC